MSPSSVTPESRNSLIEFARFREHAAVRGVTRSLDRKYEVVRRFTRPVRKRRRFLRAIVGAVDFDGGKLSARVVQFLGLCEFVGIKDAAPRLKRPAADTGPNDAAFGGLDSGLPLVEVSVRFFGMD